MNKVVLMGRLTKDPELRYTASGIAVARFTLAVDRGFKNQQGEKQADFIPITVWRGAAESCAKYLSKGRLVAVVGRIQTGSYDKDGQRVYTTDVVADEVRFLEFKKEQEDTNIPGFTPYENDEELPF
jgi:single-strand DNA-binding protein